MRTTHRAVAVLAAGALAMGVYATRDVDSETGARVGQPERYVATVDDRLPDAWACGEGTCLDPHTWKPLPSDWVDAMTEGDNMTPATAWETCWLHLGDTSWVACPDGTVEGS